MGYIIPVIIAGILIAILTFLEDKFGKANGELIFIAVFAVFGFSVLLANIIEYFKRRKANKQNGR